MSGSDESRRQLGGVRDGNRQGSTASFSSVPALNPSTRILYGPGSPMASRNASVSGPDSHSVWARESTVTLDPRASRASSIISTGTKTSVSTDYNDGNDSNGETRGGERHWDRLDGYVVPANHTDPGEASHGDAAGPHLSLSAQVIAARGLIGPELPLSQASPTVPDIDLPLSDPVGVCRNPSYTPGKETISVKKHHHSSSVSSVASASRTVSPGSPSNPPLRRSGGIKLRVVTTTGQTGNGSSPVSPGSDLWLHSQLPSAEAEAGQEPHSPAYFGTGATGIFPSPGDLSDIGGGFAKVNIGEGKVLRTPELSPHNVPARDLPNIRNGRSSPRSFSPETMRRPRPGPVPHDGGIGLSNNEAPQPMLVPESPAQIDEAVVGAQSPSAMDSENGLSTHYSRMVRTLDQSHQKEMREREEVIRGLERTILELKTELVRARHQVRAVKGPVPILQEEDTPEAKAFPFPPLKLRHVRTLRRATERRAEKLNLKPNSNSYAEKQSSASASGSGDRALDLSSRIDPNPNLQAENEGLKGMLCASQAKIENLELEVRELRESLENWTDRSKDPELQQKQDDAEHEHKKAIGRTREEVNKKWESRWKTNNEQLLDRMRRIESESQRLIKSAVEERDEEWAVTWAKKNAYLLTRLKDKEVEIKELKSAEAQKEEGHEVQLKALEKRLAAEEHHTSVLQEMLMGLETQHAKTKSELQDLKCKSRVPNQIPSLSP